MMKRVGSLVLFVLGFALPVLAQSGGVAHWTQFELPAAAQSYVYTLSNTAVPGSVAVPVVVTATCAQAVAGGGSVCTAPVSAALMVKGTFTLCASDGFSLSCSVPFTPGTVSNPGGFFISRS